MSVSVIIPSKDRPREIAHMLASLLRQPTMPLEVIVVDQSREKYALPNFPQLRHVYEPGLSGSSAARNYGADLASGDVLLFLDDDVELEADCVALVEAAFAARPSLIGAQCEIENPWDDRALTLWNISTWIFEHGFFNSRPYRRGADNVPRLISGLASAFRRSLFAVERNDDIGMSGYCLGEDWDLTKRAARHGELIIIPGAKVRHLHSSLNRHDPDAYRKLRWKNILYIYDKLDAGKDIRNRFWRWWWMFGERLRLATRKLRGEG
jgi:GT2 family glycosyltransferase